MPLLCPSLFSLLYLAPYFCHSCKVTCIFTITVSHANTSLSRSTQSDFFFSSKSSIIIRFIKNSPVSLLTDPKVSVFSWCSEDSNEVLPSFPKSLCCGKSTSAYKQQPATSACFLLSLLRPETLMFWGGERMQLLVKPTFLGISFSPSTSNHCTGEPVAIHKSL